MKVMKLARVAIKNEEGKLAVLLRDFCIGKNYDFKGIVVQLPGGKVENGQTFCQAARQELAEELGMAVDEEDLSLAYQSTICFNGESTIIKFFRLKGDYSLELEIPTEEKHKFVGGKVFWVSPEELAEMGAKPNYKIGFGIYDWVMNGL